MGFFDFLSKKKQDDAPTGKKVALKDVPRLSRLAGDKMAQNYDRQEAIDELAKAGTAEAAEGLLRRFSFTMEPSITDQEEKESAVEGIVAAGEAAIEPIRKYCARAESLTWPLKILRRVVGEEEIADELIGMLEDFDVEYMRNPEPKIQLISMLEEYPNNDVRVAVEPFLLDANETVRFHAAVTVFSMNDELSVPPLVKALTDEESLRVKNRIATGLAEKGWLIHADLAEPVRGSLPPGFVLDGERIRRR